MHESVAIGGIKRVSADIHVYICTCICICACKYHVYMYVSLCFSG